ncbi:MAG: type I methionyl aminopeptidase [Thermodesulfobacteriota bacterium]|nr:type I methionyl aminopeptidase [Thermodesulfobacteriota bacterium]|tara:strand:- start:18639 stop:19400 length:762 start_codon:yes stop_codon:yes gene_type:complete
MSVKIKNNDEINQMSSCGKIISDVREIIVKNIEPGISTWELDKLAEEYTISKGFLPAFKGYQNFPSSICASVNDEVVHGLPSKNKILKKGDIIGIDFGVYDGTFYADSAFTFPVGDVSDNIIKLLNVTKESLNLGIQKAQVGNKIYDISKAIQDHIEKNGFTVVRSYVGHGIGKDLHEEPHVPNFILNNKDRSKSMKLKEGMVLAIEPMVNVGNFEVELSDDNWTVKTCDGSLSAHFEHTVALTKDGPKILTN